MRNRKLWAAFAELTVLAMSIVLAAPAGAQTKEVKAKLPMYSYIAVWNIPRDQWEARENQAAAVRKIPDRASSDGTIVAYGFALTPYASSSNGLLPSRVVHTSDPGSDWLWSSAARQRNCRNYRGDRFCLPILLCDPGVKEPACACSSTPGFADSRFQRLTLLPVISGCSLPPFVNLD
jgi:hypothetical protein